MRCTEIITVKIKELAIILRLTRKGTAASHCHLLSTEIAPTTARLVAGNGRGCAILKTAIAELDIIEAHQKNSPGRTQRERSENAITNCGATTRLIASGNCGILCVVPSQAIARGIDPKYEKEHCNPLSALRRQKVDDLAIGQ
jgi:hypothetical protein